MVTGTGTGADNSPLEPEVIDALSEQTKPEPVGHDPAERRRAKAGLAALAELLARLEEERGPVDPNEVADFRRLLR